MSWDPTFRATLDRVGGLASARRLAGAVHMTRCQATSRDAALIGALGQVRSVGIELTDADELVADAELAIPIALDDEDVFAALADHDAIAVVRWDEPDSEIWMQYEHPHGGLADDGRVYGIELAMRGEDCELAIRTVIDHMGTEKAAAWLSERTGATITYRSPRT